MTASYSPSLRLTLQGDGDNPTTWGDVTNAQVISLIEQAVAGVATINITGSSNVNIATTTNNGASDTARNAALALTGTLGGSIQLIVPAVSKLYVINGQWSGAYTVTIIPTGGSSGLTMSSGQLMLCYIQGTNIYEVATSTPLGALLSSNNLSDVSSVSTALTNLGVGTMGTQNSNNVSITGGSITGVTGLSSVTSVAGRTGAVVLSNTDISGLGSMATQNSSSVSITGGSITGVPTSTLGTPSSFNSATTYNITGLPAGIKRLDIIFQGVGFTGAGNLLVQIGDPTDGVKNSGYSSVGSLGGSGGSNGAAFTSGFGIYVSNSPTATAMNGTLTLSLVNSSTNTWVISGTTTMNNGTGTSGYVSGGSVSLAATLDRITLTSASGTATWTAGQINYLYWM